MENILNQQPELLQEENNQREAVRTPDKSVYKNHIDDISAEAQAFLDGYLFAKVTEAAKKGA
jgi:hypothetical protein